MRKRAEPCPMRLSDLLALMGEGADRLRLTWEDGRTEEAEGPEEWQEAGAEFGEHWVLIINIYVDGAGVILETLLRAPYKREAGG